MKLILFFLLIPFWLYAQPVVDSLYFNNTDEKLAFELEQDSDFFELLYLIGSERHDLYEADYEEFKDYVQKLKEKYKNKKPEKLISNIYKDIHERYFEKYEEIPLFSDIFQSKEYNCVTATALFGIAFKELGIPFSIREVPTHVYLVAYPSTHRIILEATNPENGTMAVNARQLNRVEENLIRSKTITENESQEFDGNDIFEEYILSDSLITLTELVGIQYYNMSINAFEEEEYKKSLVLVEKALELCGVEYVKDWNKYLCLHLLEYEMVNLSSNEICYLFKKILLLNREEVSIESEAKNTYYELGKSIVVQGEGINRFQQVNDCLSTYGQTDSLFVAVSNLGNLILAEFYLRALDIDKALELLVASYNPKDLNARSLIQHTLVQHFESITGAQNGLDSLSKYENIFPFIKDDQEVQMFGMWCYAKLIYNHFELNEFDEGMLLLNEFKIKYKPGSKLKFEDQYIGSIFGSVSAYYVRKNNYIVAKEKLKEGMEYCPESLELRRKLKLIEEM